MAAAAPAAPPPPPPTELLTQLQDQLHSVSQMFFDFVGILQRDAPPLPVAGEPLVARNGADGHTHAHQQQQQQGQQQQQQQFDVEATTALMARQLVAQFKATEALIRALPDERAAPAEQSGRAAALQREHEAAAAELAAAAREAEAQLVELQRLFAVLAQQRLSDALEGLEAPPLPPLPAPPLPAAPAAPPPPPG